MSEQLKKDQYEADSLYPTPTQTTLEPTTNVIPSPPSSSECSCLCRQYDGKNITEEERAQERIAEIKKKLILRTEKLSATVRKKISAEDNRPSAQGVGYIGVVFLVVVFGSLILLDITSLGNHLSIMKKNIMGGKANDAP